LFHWFWWSSPFARRFGSATTTGMAIGKRRAHRRDERLIVKRSFRANREPCFRGAHLPGNPPNE